LSNHHNGLIHRLIFIVTAKGNSNRAAVCQTDDMLNTSQLTLEWGPAISITLMCSRTFQNWTPNCSKPEIDSEVPFRAGKRDIACGCKKPVQFVVNVIRFKSGEV
jgi:hypothetical protein